MTAIAERKLIAQSADGTRSNVMVRVEAPKPAPHDSWVCVISVEGMSHRPIDAHGADSLQALLLALAGLRNHFARFEKAGGKLYLPGDGEDESMSVSELFGNGA